MARVWLLLVPGLVSGCVGPPAPDEVLCRDVVERVCAATMCTAARDALQLPAEDCVSTVVARAGCDAADFTFATPTRTRVLECRLPLVRASETRGVAPACENLDETVRICPDLVSFLRGAR